MHEIKKLLSDKPAFRTEVNEHGYKKLAACGSFIFWTVKFYVEDSSYVKSKAV